uniref:Uncharacterized protein n=1 Tax=Romanomermis culicivorax TaxID=13658 RepID=A0A915JJY6_ROMCU
MAKNQKILGSTRACSISLNFQLDTTLADEPLTCYCRATNFGRNRVAEKLSTRPIALAVWHMR